MTVKFAHLFFEQSGTFKHEFDNASEVERSMISPDYARNFICDHILGIDSGYTQPLLF